MIPRNDTSFYNKKQSNIVIVFQHKLRLSYKDKNVAKIYNNNNNVLEKESSGKY